MVWLPPVGTMVSLRVAFSPIRSSLDETEICEREMTSLLGGVAAFAYGSGRAALASALKLLAGDRQGKGIIVPAYTCFSVPSAIARAGLRVYPVDIHVETLDFNYRDRQHPPPEDVFAVVSPGLFGMPPDMQTLEQICLDQRLFLIEDAAQTFGAKIAGRPAGTFGDLSLLSFGRGKPAGGIGGGILIARRKSIADLLEKDRLKIETFSPVQSALKSLILALAIRPGFFGAVRLLPFIRMGVSVYDPDFPIESLDPSKARLIREVTALLDGVIGKRREIAAALEKRLEGVQGIIIPKGTASTDPAYLRFPLVFEEPTDRDAALYRFTTRGLGASAMYPTPVHHIPLAKEILRLDLGPFPGAEKVSRGLVTLPTHSHVTARAIDEMAAIVREVAGAGGDVG